jgi:hypothetical protein
VPSEIRDYYAIALGEVRDLVFPVPCAGTKTVQEEHRIPITAALVVKADAAYINVGHNFPIAFLLVDAARVGDIAMCDTFRRQIAFSRIPSGASIRQQHQHDSPDTITEHEGRERVGQDPAGRGRAPADGGRTHRGPGSRTRRDRSCGCDWASSPYESVTFGRPRNWYLVSDYPRYRASCGVVSPPMLPRAPCGAFLWAYTSWIGLRGDRHTDGAREGPKTARKHFRKRSGRHPPSCYV